MLIMEKTVRFISSALCLALASAAAVIGWFYAALPASVSAERGSPCTGAFSAADIRTNGGECGYYLGAIPIKPALVTPTERPMLIPCGTPFGIRLRSEGVMVVGVTKNSPAERAGIKKGDVITEVNGAPIQTNADITTALGEESTVLLTRGDSTLCVSVQPFCDPDGALKMGAWVRDSAAGIGTLTFYEPKTGAFGGLGHAVSDETTGSRVPLSSGEITAAEIYDIVKGKQGAAGELCGVILPDTVAGSLAANTAVGVFGTLNEPVSGEALPMAFRQEVKCGPATILATLDGGTPREYSIEIERVNLLGMNGSKGMVIRITDPDLLEAAGGIVRGMSGSPIIQDGRLAGAVTHVLINDPERGYAVFAQSMLEEMESVCG